MAVTYQHQFHHVERIEVRPVKIIGTGPQAFAVRDVALYPLGGGEPVVIETYAERGVFDLPATVRED